jgi:type IV pilus assembly protein PilW
MKPTSQRATHRQASQQQAGFSLIEILVGLAIGLLATLVIMQVFSVFEGQKRTTTGSGDAQTNGSIAMYSIEHELKMSGYGLLPSATDSPLGCTTLSPGSTGITSIAPVMITDGGTGPGASDSLTIHYASTDSGGVPTQIGGISLTGANDLTVDNNMGCHVGDVALLVSGTTCNLTNVTGPTDIAVPPVISGASAVTTTVTVQSIPAVTAVGDKLSCLGAWVTSIFRVHLNYDPTGATGTANSQAYMEKATDPAVAGDPVVADIVNIQAQYGISASAGSNQVTNWVDAVDGQASGNWGPGLTLTDRHRIKAIRIAVVARNGLYEKGVVTHTCTTAKGVLNKGPCAWDDSNVDAAPKIDLSNDKLSTDPANDQHWQHYRYRVFETIIPLRNTIWAWSTL